MDSRLKTILSILVVAAIVLAFVFGALLVYLLISPGADHPPTGRTPAAPTVNPAASDPVWERIQAAGKVSVGISADYPPFAYIGPDFKIEGYDMALTKEIGKRLKLPLDIKNLAFDGLSDSLALGQIDMAIAAISVTDQRQQTMSFTNVYFVSEDAVISAKDTTIAIGKWADLAAYRVGVQKGSDYESRLLATLVEPGLMPPQALVSYQAVDDAVQALTGSHSVDLVLMDYLPANALVGKGAAKLAAHNLVPQRYAAALPKGATAWQARLNEVLAQMQADGTLAALAKQYLNIEAPLPLPTQAPAPTLPAPVPTATGAPPAPCLDGMEFVQDLSLPDNNMITPPVVAPGAVVQKSWRIRNIGTCTWNSAYRLVYVGGNPQNAQLAGNTVAIQGMVPPRATYDIDVNLVAPIWPGRYQSFWAMQNAGGAQFGQRIWAGFQVPTPPGPTPTPLPPAPVIYAFTTDNRQINQGECVNLSWQYSGQNLAMARLFRGNLVLLQDIPFMGGYSDCPPNIGAAEYRLVIDSQASGSARASQVVDVTMPLLPTPVPQPVIDYFYVDNDAITTGQCVNLSWSYSGSDVTSASIIGDGGTINGNPGPNGSMTDCPRTPGNVEYILQVISASFGTIQQSVYVSVMDPVYPTDEPTDVPPIDPPDPVWPTDEPPIGPPGPVYPPIQPRDG